MKNIIITFISGVIIGGVIYPFVIKDKPVDPIILPPVIDTIEHWVNVDSNKIIKPYLDRINKLERNITLSYEVEKELLDSLLKLHIEDSVSSPDTDIIIPIEIPIEQRVYFEADRYRAWVSGYKPQLDSIVVFNKTETIYTTETIKEIIPSPKFNLSTIGGIGLNKYSTNPYLGVEASYYLTSKLNLSIDATLDLVNRENMQYSLGLSYTLFER